MALSTTTLSASALLVLLLAALQQLQLPRILDLAFGLTRASEPLAAFPGYRCRRLRADARLQACEDMWLSEASRVLFLACSDSLGRREWMPNAARFNVSGRSASDAVLAMDVDSPVDSGFALRALQTPGYAGTNGDGRLQLCGMTGIDDEGGAVRLWLVDMKPSVDPATGAFTDHAQTGANSTIELFRAGPGAAELQHVRTFFAPQITTPNRVAALGGEGLGEGFYFSNDFGAYKVGLTRNLAPIVGYGDVSFCDAASCKTVLAGLKYPNGLVRGLDGLLYVPSSMVGGIDVYAPQADHSLTKVTHIDTEYSIDNLSVDAEGDIYAAAFPQGLKVLQAYDDPLNSFPPSAVLRVRKTPDGYEVTKILEDRDGEVLPASTTVVHDAKTGRLFLSSVISPFIAVCEKV
ncbi:hypothetical protein F5B20DRAFT_583722 [Whalleya microplaca]|nr:hypothetical protein F5B20DRAFT_583722 [Whalleya microplaca]